MKLHAPLHSLRGALLPVVACGLLALAACDGKVSVSVAPEAEGGKDTAALETRVRDLEARVAELQERAGALADAQEAQPASTVLRREPGGVVVQLSPAVAWLLATLVVTTAVVVIALARLRARHPPPDPSAT